MNEDQILTAAGAIANLMEVTGSKLDDILEVLAGNIISDEDCGRIRIYIK